MTISATGWVSLVAQLLGRDEREAVLGDLQEGDESPWQSLLAVTGLVIRREAALWRNWRPWLAAVGLALPCTFLLMGFSLSVSRAYQQLAGATILHATGFAPGPGLALLICNVVLLAAWAWTGGFMVGSISRRTVWVSAALSFAPCMFCLERFRIESLSRLCLLLFLPAAVWGVSKGLRVARIKRSSAIVLAVGVTVLTMPIWNSSGVWLPNWALCWPAWYLVATARKTA